MNKQSNEAQHNMVIYCIRLSLMQRVTPSSTKDENFWGNQSIMTSEAAIEHLSTIETCEEDLEEESHINLGIAKEILSRVIGR